MTTAEEPIHLCIGAPRSGTTWLFNNLKWLPGVFTPPVKEVRYWHGRRSDKDVLNTVKQARLDVGREKSSNIAEIGSLWLDKWEKIRKDAPPNLYEYLDLMRAKDCISVDISPMYSVMKCEEVECLGRKLPESTKVLYIMRDPIERAKSQLKLHFHLHGLFRGSADLATYEDYFSQPAQLRRCDYANIIRNWKNAFGSRMHYMLYDDLKSDPVAFLSEVLEFYEIKASSDQVEQNAKMFFGTDRNQAKASIMPAMDRNVKTIISRKVLPFVSDLAELDKDKPQIKRWLSSVEKFSKLDIKNKTPQGFSSDLLKMMRLTENIGDNCELAFWQRRHGYEPSSLFRWAFAPVDSLISFLENPHDLYEQENLSVHSPTMVSDDKWGFSFHSKLVELRAEGHHSFVRDKELFDEIYNAEKSKIDFLAYKFFNQMKNKPGIYVIKCNDGLEKEKVFKVHEILRAFNGRNVVLWVDLGDSKKIERLNSGMYRGEMHKFANHKEVNKLSLGGWTEIMKSMTEQDDVQDLLKRIIR